jgi:hypothetical protein
VLRRSFDKASGKSALHIVSAWVRATTLYPIFGRDGLPR